MTHPDAAAIATEIVNHVGSWPVAVGRTFNLYMLACVSTSLASELVETHDMLSQFGAEQDELRQRAAAESIGKCRALLRILEDCADYVQDRHGNQAGSMLISPEALQAFRTLLADLKASMPTIMVNGAPLPEEPPPATLSAETLAAGEVPSNG